MVKRTIIDLTSPDSMAKRPRLNPPTSIPSKEPSPISIQFHGHHTASQQSSIVPTRIKVSHGEVVERNGEEDRDENPDETEEHEESVMDEEAQEKLNDIIRYISTPTPGRKYLARDYENAKYIKTPKFTETSSREIDRSPFERTPQRIFRAQPTQSFPKRTVSRPDLGLPMGEEQRRDNFRDNVADWIASARLDGCKFDVDDTTGDFDYVEGTDVAKVKFEKEVMVKDIHGVWRKRSEVEMGAITNINGNPPI